MRGLRPYASSSVSSVHSPALWEPVEVWEISDLRCPIFPHFLRNMGGNSAESLRLPVKFLLELSGQKELTGSSFVALSGAP